MRDFLADFHLALDEPITLRVVRGGRNVFESVFVVVGVVEKE